MKRIIIILLSIGIMCSIFMAYVSADNLNNMSFVESSKILIPVEHKIGGSDRPNYMSDTVIDFEEKISVFYKYDNSLKQVKSENVYYKELRFNNGYIFDDMATAQGEYGYQISEDQFTYTIRFIKKYIYHTY